MNFSHVFRSIQETGGASFNLNTGDLNPTSGFMVPLSKNYERKYLVPTNMHDFATIVKAYMADHWDILLEAGWTTFIGFWVHDDRLYVDLSENIQDGLEAYQAGVERNQIAIYDCKAKEEIKIIKPV